MIIKIKKRKKLKMPKVLNHRNIFVVDRSSIFGNPFKIGPDGTREEVIEKYRQWLFSPENSHIVTVIKKLLKGKDLVCWCSPAPCHADILLELANKED